MKAFDWVLLVTSTVWIFVIVIGIMFAASKSYVKSIEIKPMALVPFGMLLWFLYRMFG